MSRTTNRRARTNYPISTRRARTRRIEQASVNLHEAALEAYCLRVLFLNPKLIYDVNRKFRELAADQLELADGVLGDLSPDDFTRTSYRILMDIFMQAIGQDEQDVSDFFQSALTPDLIEELAIVLADEWEVWRLRRQNGFYADLTIVLKQSERFSGAVDMSAELVEKALELRRYRLQRERQEMVYLEMDGDVPYQRHIMLSILAKRLIDAELNRRAQLLRQ